MPELPEVETIVRELAPRLEGYRIAQVELKKTDVLRHVSKARLIKTLRGNTIEQVTRRAKHAVFRLSSGHRMIIQPRMTGSLVVHERPLTKEQTKYAVLICTLNDGRRFVYRDVRRLGTIWLLDEKGWKAYTERIGPEPLDETFTPFVFAERLRTTRTAVKKAIMDQRRIAGVGNIYANEALFEAGIQAHTQTQSQRVCRPARSDSRDPGSSRRRRRYHRARLSHGDRRPRTLSIRVTRVRARRRAVYALRQEARHHTHDRLARDDLLSALPALVHKRPQQISALPIETLRVGKMIEVTRQIADQETAVWQHARPIVEPGLKRARTLPSLDAPMPDLDFLVDLQQARDFEHESRDRQCHLQGGPGPAVEIRGIAHHGELLFLRIAQGQIPSGLRPREAAPYGYSALLPAPHRPE